ncbi:MAG: hypothetical protein LBK70_01690 [Clostridiales bacterium]|jgi:hypothetical protein|nr:hypothetical protein [Clostridiales bacterium]
MDLVQANLEYNKNKVNDAETRLHYLKVKRDLMEFVDTQLSQFDMLNDERLQQLYSNVNDMVDARLSPILQQENLKQSQMIHNLKCDISNNLRQICDTFNTSLNNQSQQIQVVANTQHEKIGDIKSSLMDITQTINNRLTQQSAKIDKLDTKSVALNDKVKLELEQKISQIKQDLQHSQLQQLQQINDKIVDIKIDLKNSQINQSNDIANLQLRELQQQLSNGQVSQLHNQVMQSKLENIQQSSINNTISGIQGGMTGIQNANMQSSTHNLPYNQLTQYDNLRQHESQNLLNRMEELKRDINTNNYYNLMQNQAANRSNTMYYPYYVPQTNYSQLQPPVINNIIPQQQPQTHEQPPVINNIIPQQQPQTHEQQPVINNIIPQQQPMFATPQSPSMIPFNPTSPPQPIIVNNTPPIQPMMTWGAPYLQQTTSNNVPNLQPNQSLATMPYVQPSTQPIPTPQQSSTSDNVMDQQPYQLQPKSRKSTLDDMLAKMADKLSNLSQQLS